jgi:hypothetical protein
MYIGAPIMSWRPKHIIHWSSGRMTGYCAQPFALTVFAHVDRTFSTAPLILKLSWQCSFDPSPPYDHAIIWSASTISDNLCVLQHTDAVCTNQRNASLFFRCSSKNLQQPAGYMYFAICGHRHVPWLHYNLIRFSVLQLKIEFTLQGKQAVLTALKNGLQAGESVTLRPKRRKAAADAPSRSRGTNAAIEETVDDIIQKLSAERGKKRGRSSGWHECAGCNYEI